MSDTKIQKIGVMADSHDNMEKLDDAVKLFNRQKVDMVLHAGDFISPLTARPLSNLNPELLGVFGNNDGDRLFLRERFEAENVGPIKRNPHRFTVGDRTVVLMHQPRLLEMIKDSSIPDIIVYGHTHEIDLDERPPLIVNPGEVGGWMTGRCTVGIIDLRDLSIQIRDI